MLFFLNVVFIDRRGWNLRNEFAHGAVPAEAFNVNTASAVVMALIQVGNRTPRSVHTFGQREPETPSGDSGAVAEERTAGRTANDASLG